MYVRTKRAIAVSKGDREAEFIMNNVEDAIAVEVRDELGCTVRYLVRLKGAVAVAQEFVTADQNIQLSIAIHVRDEHLWRKWSSVYWVRRLQGCAECSISFTGQHRYDGLSVCLRPQCQVRLPVAVEVTRRKRVSVYRKRRGGLKCPIAVPE